MDFDPRLNEVIQEQPHPLIFVTISGAHLYGFPSPDSDYDLRGVHVLPLREVIGLETGKETIESSSVRTGLEIDLVTHDAHKFFVLLLKKNGYVLEQLTSPLVVRTSPAFDELRSLVPRCVTKFHAYHYLGFAETQWKLFEKESPRRVKPLLYVYRVLLTGIHLMRTGTIEANLVQLNDEYRLPYVPDLIARKLHGAEKGTLEQDDFTFHQSEYQRLRARLEEEYRVSQFPDVASAKPALHDLLLRLRLKE